MESRQTHRPIAVALAAALVLVACGGSEGAAVDGAGQAGQVEQGGVADAGDGADEASPDCPPEVRDGLAGPDILGVKLGMTADEALGTVRCALGEGAVVKTEARWLDRLQTYGVELGTQAFTVQKGDHQACDYQRNWQGCGFGNREWTHVDETIVVATPGVPGKETAMAIWRTQAFRESQMPPLQSVLDALTKKYGEPQMTEASDSPRGYSAGYRELQWVSDRAGNPLKAPNPLFQKCRNAISGRGEQTSASWTDGCGLNIRANVLLSGKNPGLAMELQVAMLQQSDLYVHAEATQAELKLLGETRRAAEVQQAGESSDVRL